MKTPLGLKLFFLLVIFAGCNKDESLPPAPSRILFNAYNLFPEGLAFDPVHNYFLVSSVYFGAVGSVNFDGSYNEVLSGTELNGTNGLKVDNVHKRIWVVNQQSGIGAYDLDQGNMVFFKDLSSLLPNEPLFLNDVAYDPAGNAYVTNSAYPVIYKVDINGSASVFFKDTTFATAPLDFGFNGIQYDSRGFLLVAHTALGKVLKIPASNPSGYSFVNLSANLNMPDGLLLSRDGSQVVVVSFDQVLSFISEDQWANGSVSTVFEAGYDFVTSLTSDGNRVFVLDSHLDKLLMGMDNDTFSIREVPLVKPAVF